MGITPVEATASTPPAPPAVPVASVPSAEGQVAKEAAVMAVAPIPEAPPPPPPPPPVQGFEMDVLVGEHEPSGLKVYDFVDPESGRTVVQIPINAVLDLVADIIQKLEAEGKA